MKIRQFVPIAASLFCFLHLLSGCRTTELDVVVGPPTDEPYLDGEEVDAADAWDELGASDTWDDERLEPRFLPPGVARRAPRLTVRDKDGRSKDISLSAKGEIVLVVFWSLDSWITTSAVMHGDYLARRYSDYEVEGVAIVQNPDTYNDAPDFLDSNNIALENYYDDFSALRRMSTSAGREITDELPCFFLLDSQGRVRFSKLGFAPSGVSDHRRGDGSMVVMESAPRGERIEDYLQRIIEEIHGGR